MNYSPTTLRKITYVSFKSITMGGGGHNLREEKRKKAVGGGANQEDTRLRQKTGTGARGFVPKRDLKSSRGSQVSPVTTGGEFRKKIKLASKQKRGRAGKRESTRVSQEKERNSLRGITRALDSRTLPREKEFWKTSTAEGRQRSKSLPGDAEGRREYSEIWEV